MLRKTTSFLGSALIALLPLTAMAKEPPHNRSATSVHQPVVTYTNYIYDIAGADNGLSSTERTRLQGWLDSLEVGYGDHVAIVTDEAYVSPAVRDGVADVLARRGMLVEEDSSAQAGKAPYGSVRLVLRRAYASVPGCPDWSRKSEADGIGGLSPNYGCAFNSNLAAMVANPEDLVRGETSNSDLRTATSNNAIKVYREKVPTGAGDLKTIRSN